MGGGLYPAQVELGKSDSSDRRDDNGKHLGRASRHHGVDGRDPSRAGAKSVREDG
jgi:hypothetical protein